MRGRKPGSLRTGLALAALVCWLLPILIITVSAGVMLNAGYNESLRRSVDADALAAMGQAELRLEAVIEDSKAVSYDGVIRRTYRDYQLNLVRFFVYRDVTEYLAQEFTRNSSYRAVFISFLAEDLHTYAAAPGTAKQNLLRHYTTEVLPAVRELLAQQDTGIYFLSAAGSCIWCAICWIRTLNPTRRW